MNVIDLAWAEPDRQARAKPSVRQSSKPLPGRFWASHSTNDEVADF
jgi:hypothetical protein